MEKIVKITMSHDENAPKPYAIRRIFQNGQYIIWARFLLRLRALQFAQQEAKHYKVPLEINTKLGKGKKYAKLQSRA